MTATIPDSSQLTGQMIIAGVPVSGTGEEIRGFDPTAGVAVEPPYRYGDATHVDSGMRRRRRGVPGLTAPTTSEQRAQFLETIAANLEARSAAIIARAVTGVGSARGPHHG